MTVHTRPASVSGRRTTVAAVSKGPGRSGSAARRIAMVLAREPWGQELSGETGRHLRRVHDALARCGPVIPLGAAALGGHRPLLGLLGTAGAVLGDLLRGRALPFRCLPFAARRTRREVLARLRNEGIEVLYLDGLPLYPLLAELPGRLKGVRVVVDLGGGPDISAPGAPGLLRGLLATPVVARGLARYEAAAVRRVERAVLALGDAVVVASAEAKAALAERAGDADAARRIHVIPPPADGADDHAAPGGEAFDLARFRRRWALAVRPVPEPGEAPAM